MVECMVQQDNCILLPRFLTTRTNLFSIKRVYFGEIMGKSGWDVVCSSDYSDTQLDTTTWDLGGEKDEFAISSEKPVPSVCSGEEVHSTKCAIGDEEESEPSKGKAKGKYKCEVCGVLHLKPSLLKQHMYSHSKDVSECCLWQCSTSNRC